MVGGNHFESYGSIFYVGGILLVIIGHTIGTGIIRGPIFSFHMPLFFAVSGMTYKRPASVSELARKIRKSFYQLIVPTLMIFLIRVVVGFYDGAFVPLTIDKFLHWLELLLWSSGADMSAYGIRIDAIGMIWFLVCLFSARVFYMILDYALRNQTHSSLILTIATTLALIAGVLLGKFDLILPLSLDLTLIALFFYYFGKLCACKVIGKKTIELDKMMQAHNSILAVEPVSSSIIKRFAIATIVWAGGFAVCFAVTHSYFEMACRHFPLFPVCIIVACVGFLMCMYASQIIEAVDKRRGLKSIKFLAWCGMYSMQLFIVHCLDFIWKPLYMVSNGGVNSVLRVVLDCLVCYCIVKIMRVLQNSFEDKDRKV